MKQLLIKKGSVFVGDIPAPIALPGTVLVRVEYSLVSTGTETSMIKSSGESLVTKAKNPTLFKMGMEAVKRNGPLKTLQMLRGMQDSFTAFGYSLSGVVTEVGTGVTEFKVGDRVACAGAGKANHAEYVSVPKNLVVAVPNNVSLEDAASTTLGSIALQGVRQADLRMGEIVVVIGGGLVGLLAVQMLKASGCIVLVSDTDPSRLKMARSFGADHTASPGELEKLVANLYGTHGVDATLITAATSSSAPLNQAMAITRKRGTVVIVGAIGMQLSRSPFYEKEINLKISCSYGPGRYDYGYEEQGIDYPYGFVRWTENRNMQAYLGLISQGKLSFQAMVAKVVEPEEAPAVYASLNDPENKNKPLAVLIRFQAKERKSGDTVLHLSPEKKSTVKGRIAVGMIGVGGFASDMHVPNIAALKDDFELYALSGRDGARLKNLAKRFGASVCTTDYKELLKDPHVDLVCICTRHNTHASLTIEALNAGKSVFVEKPLALSEEELVAVQKALSTSKGQLFVGFNRRFSPHAVAIKKALNNRLNPLMAYYRMNAGFIPASHWVQTEEGGGRLLGEACHIFDLFTYWTGSTPVEITVNSITPVNDEVLPSDNMTTTIRYADGSVCTLIYTAQGSTELAKESAELFFDRKSIVMTDYFQTTGYGTRLNLKTTTVDKGHVEEFLQVAKALRGEENSWDIAQIITATQVSLMANNQVKNS